MCSRIPVAVHPAIAFLKFAESDDLDFDVGQPVWRMSDLKMPEEMDLEQIPSDHPSASTIFLKKSQKDVRGKNMKNNSYHVSPGRKHSSCSTIFLDESTLSKPNVKIIMHSLVLAIYYHIKNRHANRTKDIFEEHLHPFIEETKRKKYFLHSPDPESIYAFICPLFNAFKLTSEFAITILVYLERLVMYAEIDIGPTNWKRVVLGAILLSSKYLYDLTLWNVHFCKVLKSITLKDLNELERQYIYLLQFNLYVSASVYAKYYFDLQTLAGDHGLLVVFAPLRKERAQNLKAISRYCENPNLCRVAIKKFSSCDNFTDPQIANAILS
ncbi:cyclin-Y-like protein 1 isoform 2-T3 [Molossus nigricans]